MHGTQKPDSATTEVPKMPGAKLHIGIETNRRIARLKKHLVRLEHECIPKRRGRPFLHRTPAKAFDLSSRHPMTSRDCFQHLLFRLNTAEKELQNAEAYRAMETVRSIEFALRMVTDRVAIAA